MHTVKLNPDGTVEKLRSRLVAKGFEQEQGLNYLKMFSSVVRTAIRRLMFDIAIEKVCKTRQLNVSGVFLHGKIRQLDSTFTFTAITVNIV